MKIYDNYVEASKEVRGASLAIGNFDGVHVGHQALLKNAIELAQKLHTLPVAYTFSPHPAKILYPQTSPLLIMTEAQKCDEIVKNGIENIICEHFTIQFSHTTAQQFIDDVLLKSLAVKSVVVGENFVFGHQATGTVSYLKDRLAKAGVATVIVSPVMVNGEVCSSSLIRKYIQQGEVARARALLGRPFALTGKVVRGAGRGRTIGVPSVNLAVEQELQPANGVYATQVILPNGKKMLGATNIGTRPTFDKANQIHIETHILDFNGNLYDQTIVLEFIQKIRDEKKFSSVEQLQEQIKKDLQEIRDITAQA